MKLIKNFLLNYLGLIKCTYYKPIVSRYISFNTRQIIYESSNGERIMKIVQKDFSDSFPIETTPFLSLEDMNIILNNKPKAPTSGPPIKTKTLMNIH